MAEQEMPSIEESIEQEVNFTRIFDAPRTLVFAAWTDPKHLARWWGPHHFTNPVCELDARPGGAIRIHMRAPDGTIYPMTGTFQEVVEPERLVYLSAALDAEGNPLFEVLTTVTFTELEGRTTQIFTARVLTSTTAAAPFIKGMEAGWTQSLERLENHLAEARKAGGENEEKHASAEDTADREIVITRLLNAPRDLVFTAWIDPNHVAQWWGPNGFTTTTHEMDVRPGGTWRFIMHGPNGVDYPNRIDYEEVVRPERLVYTHGTGAENDPGQFHVTVTFAEQEGGTALTMRSLFASAAARNKVVTEFKAIEGGNQTLDRLQKYVAAM